MLDPKHKNIGATVGMVKEIHKLSHDPLLAEELTKLFMEESNGCDYKHETAACIFNGSTESNMKCRVGNCPLGPLVDEELKFGSDPDRLQLYGKNTMNYGSHIHIGHTGWRKYWNMFKKNLFHGWIDWFKEWPSYLFHNWKINLLIVIGVFAVYYGSALAGYISGTYF
jgi:hypothetical protein